MGLGQFIPRICETNKLSRTEYITMSILLIHGAHEPCGCPNSIYQHRLWHLQISNNLFSSYIIANGENGSILVDPHCYRGSRVILPP